MQGSTEEPEESMTGPIELGQPGDCPMDRGVDSHIELASNPKLPVPGQTIFVMYEGDNGGTFECTVLEPFSAGEPLRVQNPSWDSHYDLEPSIDKWYF